MKIIVAAFALAIAFPAAAQTTPAPHQGHDQHQAAQHGQHQPGQHQGHDGHGQHQPGQHQGHSDGCCADRNSNGRMDCCENMAQGEGRGCCAEWTPQPARTQPQAHQNH